MMMSGMVLGIAVMGVITGFSAQERLPMERLQAAAPQVEFDQQTVQAVKDANCAADCTFSIDEPFTVGATSGDITGSVEIPSMTVKYTESGEATATVLVDGEVVPLGYFAEKTLQENPAKH